MSNQGFGLLTSLSAWGKKNVTSGCFDGHSKSILILAFRLLSFHRVFGSMGSKTQKTLLPYSALINRSSLMGWSFLSQGGTESFPDKDLSCWKRLVCRSSKAHFTLGRHLSRCSSLAKPLLEEDPEEPVQGKSDCWGCPRGESCGNLESEFIVC